MSERLPSPAGRDPGARPREPTEPRRPLGALVAGFSLRWMGFSFYSFFVLLFLHQAFDLSFADAGLDLAVVALVSLPFSQVGGELSDRWGRRRVIVLSLAGEAVGLAVLAWGFTIASLPVVVGALVLSRTLAALGFPATLAYVRDSTDAGARADGLSWLRVGGNLGAVGGVALAGVLLAVVAYGRLTAIAAALVGAGAAANALWLRPSARDRTLRPLVARPELVGAKAVHVVRRVGGSLRRSFGPIGQDRTLLGLVVAITLIYLLNLQIGYAIPTYGLATLGIPYGILGAALALNGLIPVLGQIPITRALAGRPLTRVGVWGVTLYALSFLVLGLEGSVRWEVVPVFAAVVVVSTLGENLCFLPVFTLPLNIAPAESRGVYSGAILTSVGIGGIFAPLLAGVALGFSADPLLTWGILAVPAVPAAAILARLGTRVPAEQNRL